HRGPNVAIPMRQIPALPARDVGAQARVVWPGRIRPLASDILHDRHRLPQLEVAIDQSRRASGRVNGDKSGRLLAAFAEVNEFEFERHPEIAGERANLPSVWRRRETIQLHGTLLVREQSKKVGFHMSQKKWFPSVFRDLHPSSDPYSQHEAGFGSWNDRFGPTNA